MSGPVLYSTNPWYALEIARKYRNGVHFAWCGEYFDPATAPAGSAGTLVAPSSSPRGIYESLLKDVQGEDTHSAHINRYKRKFRSLAIEWESTGALTESERKEIHVTVNSKSWKIWRPILFVIPRMLIDPARIIAVPRKGRAAYGPELQIADLRADEFDAIELQT